MKISGKLLVPLVSVALILAVFLGSSSGYIQGDMNDDRDVTFGDAILITKFPSKVEIPTQLQEKTNRQLPNGGASTIVTNFNGIQAMHYSSEIAVSRQEL